MTWAVPDWWTVVLLWLAAYRVWRLLAHDTILDPIRRRFVRSDSRTVGLSVDFIECPFCLGFWISLAWWLAWVWQPHWALVIAAPFAISALVALVAVNLDPD
jgi:hypothetical protein